MAKSFVVSLRQHEYSSEDYNFSGINKIADDGKTIITEMNYGQDINLISGAAAISLSLEELESLYSTLSNREKPKKSEGSFSIPDNWVGNKKVLFIKIPEAFIKKHMVQEGIDEREFVCRLWNVFISMNFSISKRKDHFSGRLGNTKPVLNFSVKPEPKFINKDHQVITTILTLGKPKQVVNAGGGSTQPSATSSNKSVRAKVTAKPISELKPDEVIAKIKEKIIDQDETITTVVETIFWNQMLIDMNDPTVLSSKSNILIDGPTGTGKTFLMKEISNLLSLPIEIVSATSLSTTGYKGNNLDTLLIALLDKAGGDLELAQRGIIVLDEFDKLGNNDEKMELAIRNGIQEELLTYASGAKFTIQYNGKDVEFDTSKVTFVGLGAFTKLRERKIAENEMRNSGEESNNNEQFERTYTIDPDDYIGEGISRELIGRFKTIAHTNALGKRSLLKILRESSTSPIISCQKLANFHGKTFTISDDTLESVAEQALEMNTGARALENILEPVRHIMVKDLMDPQKQDIIITINIADILRKSRIRRY